FAGGEVGGAEGFGGGEFGGDGCGGAEGVLKAKSNGVIGKSVRVMSIAIEEEDDVPLVDGVLKGAIGAFSDRGLCFGDGVLKSSWLRFERMPWMCLRLKMNEEDDDLKMKIGNHFIKDLLGLKDFKMILRVTTAQLQLLSDYYYWKEYADRDEIKDSLENKNTYEDKY
ncbi:hypothetical protein Tco_1357101, partial [Tanacetum coccineum]